MQNSIKKNIINIFERPFVLRFFEYKITLKQLYLKKFLAYEKIACACLIKHPVYIGYSNTNFLNKKKAVL